MALKEQAAKRPNTKEADAIWGREITNLKQKQQAVQLLVKRLKKGDVVGVGSGSTSFVTIKALAARRIDFWAIPTSLEMEMICAALSIPTTSLLARQPDWSFDGADEVDSKGNMIKGRGGAMLREKLVMRACPEVYIVIDESKQVKRLGQKFPVPVEIYPHSLKTATKALEMLPGVKQVQLRQAVAKDGPVVTENGNLILDVSFNKIPSGTEEELKSITGVMESGLFMGYKPTIVSSGPDGHQVVYTKK